MLHRKEFLMTKMIRVCGLCLRPVSSSYFIVRIGCTCPVHGRMYVEETIKVPQDKANYTSVEGT